MIDFIDKTSEQKGTPINRKNLMAMQGFEAETKEYENGTIKYTNSVGDVLTYKFGENNSGSINYNEIIITFTSVDGRVIQKVRTYNNDNTYTEVIE